jgi:hypothetical protein
VKFLGYHVISGIPEFHYRVDDTEVFEKVTAKEAGIAVQFRVIAAKGEVFVHAKSAGNAAWQSSVGEWSGGVLRLSPAQAMDFILRLPMPDSTAVP